MELVTTGGMKGVSTDQIKTLRLPESWNTASQSAAGNQDKHPRHRKGTRRKISHAHKECLLAKTTWVDFFFS